MAASSNGANIESVRAAIRKAKEFETAKALDGLRKYAELRRKKDEEDGRRLVDYLNKIRKHKKSRDLLDLMAAIDSVDDYWIPSVVAITAIDPMVKSIARKLGVIEQMKGSTRTPDLIREILKALVDPKRIEETKLGRMKESLRNVQILYSEYRNKVVHDGEPLEENEAWKAVNTVRDFYQAFRGFGT